MSYGNVSAVINVQPVIGASAYIAGLDWAPISDEADPASLYTVSVVEGDNTVTLPNAPTVTGTMYCRVYALNGSTPGRLSNEVSVAYDFRLDAPVITLVG